MSSRPGHLNEVEPREGRFWVDLSGSLAASRTAGIGAGLPV